mmetsp:Transcript_40652/g.96632  ORF Transcript_40652/g.96632 Transcript_40652/m.96632 type:complete len:207 (-) Transcript_40652:3702-4322(-)
MCPSATECHPRHPLHHHPARARPPSHHCPFAPRQQIHLRCSSFSSSLSSPSSPSWPSCSRPTLPMAWAACGSSPTPAGPAAGIGTGPPLAAPRWGPSGEEGAACSSAGLSAAGLPAEGSARWGTVRCSPVPAGSARCGRMRALPPPGQTVCPARSPLPPQAWPSLCSAACPPPHLPTYPRRLRPPRGCSASSLSPTGPGHSFPGVA